MRTPWLDRAWAAARAGTLFLVLALFLAACGDEVRSGELTGRVQSSETTIGAAVFELTLPGIQGVDGAGSTRVVARSVEGRDAFRVVAANPDGGGIQVRIRVSDVTRVPTGSIIFQASDTDNQVVGPGVPLELVVER